MFCGGKVECGRSGKRFLPPHRVHPTAHTRAGSRLVASCACLFLVGRVAGGLVLSRAAPGSFPSAPHAPPRGWVYIRTRPTFSTHPPPHPTHPPTGQSDARQASAWPEQRPLAPVPCCRLAGPRPCPRPASSATPRAQNTLLRELSSVSPPTPQGPLAIAASHDSLLPRVPAARRGRGGGRERQWPECGRWRHGAAAASES